MHESSVMAGTGTDGEQVHSFSLHWQIGQYTFAIEPDDFILIWLVSPP